MSAPLTSKEKQTITSLISIFFDETETDPHSILAEALGCDRNTAKTKFYKFLYTDLGFIQKVFVRKQGLEIAYLTSELAKLTNLTRLEVQQNAWDHADSKYAQFTQRRGLR